MMRNEKEKHTLCFSRKKNITIGAGTADIEINDLGCSLLIENNDLTYSWNGTDSVPILINGRRPEAETYRLDEGDELCVKDYQFVFLRDRIMLCGQDLSNVTAHLLEIPQKRNVSEEFPKYKRSPRIIKRVSGQDIKLSRPK